MPAFNKTTRTTTATKPPTNPPYPTKRKKKQSNKQLRSSYLESEGNDAINEHGIQQRRGILAFPVVTPIPDLRPGLDSPTSSTNKPPFQGFYTHTHTPINSDAHRIHSTLFFAICFVIAECLNVERYKYLNG